MINRNREIKKVETMQINTEVLSDLDLEVVTGGKAAEGLARAGVGFVAGAVARPWLELVGNQAGYTIGENVGRSLGSGS